MTRRFTRLPEVRRTVALQTTAIYQRERDGTFPKRLKLTQRSVAWIEDEISEWLDAKISGANDDELRELVQRQLARRTAARRQSEAAAQAPAS